MTFTQSEIKKYAIAYERGKDSLQTISADTIKELHEYINREFKPIENITEFYSKDVPCNEMRAIYTEIGILAISAINNNSELFPNELNLKFRAIHDYIHLTKNFGCDYEGEYLTFLEQSKGLSKEAKQVLFSEIVLQACFFLHFGFFPKKQKIVIYDNPEFLNHSDEENIYLSLLTM